MNQGDNENTYGVTYSNYGLTFVINGLDVGGDSAGKLLLVDDGKGTVSIENDVTRANVVVTGAPESNVTIKTKLKDVTLGTESYVKHDGDGKVNIGAETSFSAKNVIKGTIYRVTVDGSEFVGGLGTQGVFIFDDIGEEDGDERVSEVFDGVNIKKGTAVRVNSASIATAGDADLLTAGGVPVAMFGENEEYLNKLAELKRYLNGPEAYVFEFDTNDTFLFENVFDRTVDDEDNVVFNNVVNFEPFGSPEAADMLHGEGAA